MKIGLSFIVFFLLLCSVSSQNFRLKPEAKISVLTIGPGESLNDAFGHNAFRIKDRSSGIDIVYGYGEYDFDAPNFYLKFAQGKLNYLISRHNYADFYNYYTRSNRTIKEQVLNFSIDENQKLFNYLETNYKPENRRYLYDFFYDNCATKIRDVAQIAAINDITYVLPETLNLVTFRDLIHEHVGLNSWGSFGIDLALGSVIDKKATAYEHMFLPKYVHIFFENAKTNSLKNLVKNSSTVFKKNETVSNSNVIFSPLVILGLLSLLILFITFKDYKKKTRSKWLDLILFCTTGIIGIVILLLWFATDHSATAQNYNVLWAVPLNIFVIGQLLKKQVKKWFKSYVKFLIIMLCLMTLHWIIGVQIFSIALIPVVLALLIRYIYLIRSFSYE